MGLILGIDDAGRGPVLGPMILAGVLLKEKDELILKEWGAKDSKLLLPAKRKKISEQIKKQFTHHIESTTPKEIDDSPNLNHLEAIKAAMIINKLTENLNEKIKVIIDCPSINIKSWQKFLEKILIKKDNIKLQCEHKADVNHLVVSAASIIAKEKREDELKELKKQLNINFGSGYPADPKTKEFLEKNYKNPKYEKIIRKSWNTYKKLIKSHDEKQKRLF